MKACITIKNGKSMNIIYNNRIHEKEIYKQLTYCTGKLGHCLHVANYITQESNTSVVQCMVTVVCQSWRASFKITFNVLTYTQQIQKLVRMTKGCGISNKIPNIQTRKIQSIIKSNEPLNSYTSTYEILNTHTRDDLHRSVWCSARHTWP